MDYATPLGSPNFLRLSAWRDNLVNFINSLGTTRDPTQASQYYFQEIDRHTLENAYRSDWIARIVIDAPADDATREWRNWQATSGQIEALEEIEKEHKLQQKVRQWIVRARLYGGAALVLGIDDGRESWEEVDVDAVKKDSLQFIVVMNRYELMAGPRIYNVSSPWYTRPEFYTVAAPVFGFYGEEGGSAPGSMFAAPAGVGLATKMQDPLYARPQGQSPRGGAGGQSNVVRLTRGPAGGFGGDPAKQVTPPTGMVRLHPSRVVELAGNELPDWRLAPMGGGWGDSVLQTVDESLKDWGLTVGSIANMTNDAKTDVIKIKDFTQKVQTAEYKQKLLDRWTVANLSKSTINALLLDTEEEWERIQTSFGGLAELLREYMVVISGASGIPVSRLFGQSSGRGLGAGSSGGEQDMVNYYDRVSQWQRNTVTPAMTILNQVLIRSTFGKPIASIHYDWAPLWQMSAAEKGKVWESKAHVYQIDVQQGLINEDALRRARINQLIEDGVYPGLEAAIDEFGEEPDIPEARMWSPAMGIDPNTGMPVGGGGGGPPGGAPGPGGAPPSPQGGPPKVPPPPAGGAKQAKPPSGKNGNGKNDNGKQPAKGAKAKQADEQPDLFSHHAKRQPRVPRGHPKAPGSFASHGGKEAKRKHEALLAAGSEQENDDERLADTDFFTDPDKIVHPIRGSEGYEGGEKEGGTTKEQSPEIKGVSTGHEAVRATADKVADKLGFDKSKIDVSNETRKFTLNGKEYNYAGAAHLNTGRITLYPEHMGSEVVGVVAHEIGHQKFQNALNRYRDESNMLSTEQGPAPKPDSEHWWERRGGSDAVMKASGELHDPYKEKYPNYSAMHDALYQHDTTAFSGTDGVSGYSADWWEAYHKGTATRDQAMHETLAEMTRIKHQTGKFPEHTYGRMMRVRGEGAVKLTRGQEAEGTARWRKLYRTVEAIHKKAPRA